MYKYSNKDTRRLNYGINSKCILISSKSSAVKVIFKSERGESKSLQKALMGGTLCEREILAYRLDKEIFKWNIIPPTKELWYNGNKGSAQRFITDGKHESYYNLCEYKRFTKIIIFDYLLNHGDRHTDNLMIKGSKAWAIDNGNICPDFIDNTNRSVGNIHYLINEHIKYVCKLLSLVDINSLCKHIPYVKARAKTEERYNLLLSSVSKYETWNDIIKDIHK